jgi:hypothetical protein
VKISEKTPSNPGLTPVILAKQDSEIMRAKSHKIISIDE